MIFLQEKSGMSGPSLGTPYVLLSQKIAQVVDNNMVDDTGFEPVTSGLYFSSISTSPAFSMAVT